MIKLSIIVPVYNLEKYIGECLASLLNQDLEYSEYEVLVVDDGSTDNSGNIIDVYAEKYSNVHAFHKGNGGVSSARNLALEKSQGEYIWFVDGDDLIASSALKDMLEQIYSNHEPDLLRIIIIDFKDGEHVDLDKRNYLGNERHSDWIVTWIIKRSLILDNNISFDERVSFGEDDIFCVFVRQHVKRIIDYPWVGYFYRQREGSALHSAITEDSFMKFVRSYKADLEYAEKYDFFWYKKDSVYKNMSNVMLFVAMQPFKKRREKIRILKENNLFPLPVKKTTEKDNIKISGFKRIRQISCTKMGLMLLEAYLWEKNVEKIFRRGK